jgi:hypothetical protein
MSSEELYYEFSLILNKNYSQKNVNYDRGNFVKIYNRELLLWLNDFISKSNPTSDIQGIQGLATINEKLELENKNSQYYSYILPSKFHDFIDCYSLCEKDGCEIRIPNEIEKPKLVQSALINYSPSFEFEEGLCNIAAEKVIIYLGDFKINGAYLSYYNTPQQIDLEGYERIDGSMSVTIDSDLDEVCQHQVINRTVTEVMRQFENGNGFNMSSTRPKV